MVNSQTHPSFFDDTTTIPELLNKRVQQNPDDPAFATDQHNNWNWTSWKDLSNQVNEVSWILQQHGFKAGDVIAIMASTSLSWDIIQYAILAIGGIVVGIDSHDTDNNIRHIIEHADVRGIIADKQSIVARFPFEEIKQVSAIFAINTQQLECLLTEIYRSPQSENPTTEEKTPLSIPTPDSLATIIFTSGTTGLPKGIPYTHKQVIEACKAVTNCYNDFDIGARLVCWLPLSNLFQRMMNYCAIATGAKTFYVSDPKEIISYLPRINPDVFIAVPRFYEKLYEGVQNKITSSSLLIRGLFSSAVKIATHKRIQSDPNSRAKKLLKTLIFAKLRTTLFGTNLKYAISGSAPMPIWLLQWYDAIGVTILEAYGISENIIPVACNTLKNYKFGTVGKAVLPGSVRLTEGLEIEVSGPGVFHGYLEPAPGNRNLTGDNYLQTGDKGSIDTDGFISLHGRTNDFFKTSTGKRISPLPIEKQLRQCTEIEHIIVIGEGRKVPIACATVADINRAKVEITYTEKLRADINNKLTDTVSDQQKPAALLLLLTEFSISGGELTANLKLRKKFIQEKYREDINKSYLILQDSKNKGTQQISDQSILVIL